MRAVVYDRYGSPDVMELRDLPTPNVTHVTRGRILVRVRAASVNPVDWKIRRGELKLVTGRRFPRIPGIDFSGIVEHVGPGVDRFRIGDAVLGVLNPLTTRLGSTADYVIARDSQVAHLPPEVSFLEAATVPCAGLTAWHALRDLAQLRSGQRVLINGASGGVGSFAVQIAGIMGAGITGTCGADNVDYVRELGAEQVIDYRVQDLRLLPGRFDAILDASAKLSYPQIAHLLGPRGVYASTLPTPQLVLRALISKLWPGKKARIVALNGRESVPKALTDIAGMMAAGRIRARVQTVFGMEQLADAHRAAEAGHARGKSVIRVSGEHEPEGQPA